MTIAVCVCVLCACVRACMHDVCACMHVYACVCAPACMHVCVHMCMLSVCFVYNIHCPYVQGCWSYGDSCNGHEGTLYMVHEYICMLHSVSCTGTAYLTYNVLLLVTAARDVHSKATQFLRSDIRHT